MFGKQSPGPFHCDPFGCGREVHDPSGAPLLPKLRGYFAEFLSGHSLTRLGILSRLPVSACRYGQPKNSLEVFSAVESASWIGRSRTSCYPRCDDPRICLRDPPTSPLTHPIARYLSFCVTPSYKRSPAGAGMLTCSPSPTPIGLGLGTD